ELPLEVPAGTAEVLAPGTRDHLVDRHGEHLSGDRSAYLQRADHGVPGVELGLGPVDGLAGAEQPRRVGEREPHRVARLDLEHRSEVAGEVTVERRGAEREVVDHAGAATVDSMPSASATAAVKPRSRAARVVSRTLRLASPARGGPRAGGACTRRTRSHSACRSATLVSMPVPTLKTPPSCSAARS